MCRGRLASVVLCLAADVGAASAQIDTRAELLARERAEKATRLHSYEPEKLEQALLFVEEHDPLRWLAPYNGFYIQYGYTGKPVGSGIAFGGGWRHDLLDRQARVVFEAGQSFRDYRMVRADFSLPRLLDEHLEAGFEAAYHFHPQQDFYGMGFSSQRSDRVNFRFRAVDLQGRLVLTPAPWLNVGVRLGRMNVDAGPGTDKRFPSIERRFSEEGASGLLDQPDYVYGDLFTTLDTRDQPGNARAGSYVGMRWRRYNDQELGRHDFHAVDVDAQQFLPIFDKKRVVAVRVQLMTTTAADGHEVPFYFRPTIGGSDTLRSASDYRFRDRNALAMNVEYRWEAFSGLDMALFSDFGVVAPRVHELEFAGLRGAYGIGLRFNTYKAVFLRLDVAAGGSEGIRTFLKYSKAF